MAIKKLDNRIVEYMERSISSRHRSMFFVCGDKSMDQVGYIHYTLQKCRQEANMKEPSSILWCFKKVPVTENHRKRSLKRLRNCYTIDSAPCDDTMENFILSSNPYLCHYSDTEKILGQTFSMLVVQDFEALTPNTLARIIECVEGGGIIIFVLPVPVMKLLGMQMDAHAKFATESHPCVKPLFNHRFVASLKKTSGCMVLDDQLQIEWSPEPQVSFPAIVS
ncbi:hypothetical protein JTE90_021506 [Oedothorax gibbosus]|uniref:TmcA/NAT10 N-terminal domain-containing protein n=1 Tax=Oedothorax gibbosus TaxID=931172 RepID=A0AAV6VR76_9ARAC|nr:hypothetical protein JTE90_021506 [Oedothorax gibbosus]